KISLESRDYNGTLSVTLSRLDNKLALVCILVDVLILIGVGVLLLDRHLIRENRRISTGSIVPSDAHWQPGVVRTGRLNSRGLGQRRRRLATGSISRHRAQLNPPVTVLSTV